MNKILRNLLIGAVGVMGFTACYDDDSSMGSGFTDITLGELTDQTAISYIGQVVEVHPTVEGYSDSDLDYAWYIFQEVEGEEYEEGYRQNKIADTKDLSYEVNLSSGNYTLVFEATERKTGLVRTATMKLSVSTSFSRGYYLLKETADGQTELDMINENGVAGDLMTNTLGAPLSGKPRNLSVVYATEYIDRETNETASATMLHLFTEQNEYRAFRTEDLVQTFNQDQLFYSGAMSASEQPAAMFNVMFCICYLSNTGARGYTANGSMGYTPGTGRFGYPVGGGASKFAQYDAGGYAMLYWNEPDHALYSIDYNITSGSPVDNYSGEDFPANLSCIASGINYVAWSYTYWFLCEQASTHDRYLLLASSSYGIDQIIKIESDLHLAKSSVVAGNVFDAGYIYSAEGDKVYAYSWETGSEMEVPLPGFTSGEEITYLSCPFLNLGSMNDMSQNFSDFVVATKKGSGYKVYLYHENVMNGGVPIGNPEVVAGENGVIRCMRYVSPLEIGYMDFMFSDMFGPVYPFTD